MQAKDSRSPAHPEPPRQRLTSPWTLLGIAVAVGITLVLIFPGGGILTTTIAPEQLPPDAVGLTYLENMARKEPQNPELRFTLAQKQTELGRIPAARAALEPLYNSPDPAVRQRARLQDFKLQMQQMQALPAGSPERTREATRLREELVAMSQYEWDVSGLLDLSEIANTLEARKLRSDLLLRIARTDNKIAREWVDDAGRKALADGQYVTAADIYFTAQARAQSVEDQKYYFTSAIRAYQAGNMPREALAAAESNLDSLATDDETLHFMIDLARAANDMKRAQTYVKRLLRMSQLDGVMKRWLKALASFAIPSAVAAEREAPRSPPRGMRPYDAEDYNLAYEIFLANRNLQDAYRVASAAVQQVPGDMRWRERLAQVAEWSGKPGEALEQWLYIARRTGNANAWRAVLRIAPGMADDEVVLEAMRYQAGKTALTEDQWRAIAAAYERVGRPGEAIAFLEQEYARRPNPVLNELLATLYEREGRVDAAIDAYRRMIQTSGATTERVTTLASLYIKKGDYKQAYDVLEQHRASAPPEDVEYLRTLGDLALRLRDETAARAQYERLVEHPRANLDDYTRLVNLLAPRQPEAAARLAEAAHQRFYSPPLLLTALGLHSQRRDMAALRRIFSTMSPKAEKELSTNSGFLLLRADYRAATGSPELAHADYREALRLDPNNRYARMGLMYFLIDRHKVPELRAELPHAVKLAETDPEFSGVVGSAYLTLGEHARAVPYFAAMVKQHPDEYLWLLNYADALERNLQKDSAWRVRRHAWFKLREKMQKTDQPSREMLYAQARLAVHFMPGDQGHAVIRNLLRLDRESGAASDDAREQELDAATKELTLAWLVSTEQHIGAKAWLWKQYARGLSAPTWGKISVALAHSDLDLLQKALEDYPDQIPRYDRHEAARRTQQYRLGQTIAFTELEKYPYDDEMHLRLTQSTFDMVGHAEAGYTRFTRGTVAGHEWTGEAATWLGPRLRLSFNVSQLDQGLLNTVALASIPSSDTVYGVTALWRHAVGETTFSIFHREALADTTGFSLVHSYPFGNRMTGRLGFAYNERTLETSGLLAGGVRDQVFAGLHYRLSKREYILGELFSKQYYTQDARTKIGSAYGLNWEAGHRFRTEYPDFHVRVAGSINHYSLRGWGDAATAALNPAGTIPSASFFLPGSFSVYGIYTGFGTYYRTTYTRALRPFIDVGINRNTVTGTGYAALAGISGSVVGLDRLTLYASAGQGGTGTDDVVREVGLRYMYLFDNF